MLGNFGQCDMTRFIAPHVSFLILKYHSELVHGLDPAIHCEIYD